MWKEHRPAVETIATTIPAGTNWEKTISIWEDKLEAEEQDETKSEEVINILVEKTSQQMKDVLDANRHVQGWLSRKELSLLFRNKKGP